MELRWRTVVVTCAGTPLGRDLAVRFARAGAGVVAVDRDAEVAAEVAALARPGRVQTWSVQADVTDEDDVALLVARLRDLGGADLVLDLGGTASRLGPALPPGVPLRPVAPDEAGASVVERVRAD